MGTPGPGVSTDAGAGIGKDGRLGPGCRLIATADIVASRDNPHQARAYCNPRNRIATVIEELRVLGIVLRGFHIRSYTWEVVLSHSQRLPECRSQACSSCDLE